jgi:hypothetical protein
MWWLNATLIFLASHMVHMFLTPPHDDYSLGNVGVLNLILAANSFWFDNYIFFLLDSYALAKVSHQCLEINYSGVLFYVLLPLK